MLYICAYFVGKGLVRCIEGSGKFTKSSAAEVSEGGRGERNWETVIVYVQYFYWHMFSTVLEMISELLSTSNLLVADHIIHVCEEMSH